MNSVPNDSPPQHGRGGAEHSDSDAAAPRRFRGTRGIILVIVILVAGPVCYREFPREMARWQVASAQNSYADGDESAAMSHLEKAFAWDPQNETAMLQRARWRADKREFDAALSDYAQLLTRNPESIPLLQERSDVLVKADKFEAAVQDWQEIERLSAGAPTEQRAIVLNGIAYFRAVANLELQQGLDDVELAIKLVGPNAEMLDTRGFLHYRLGNDDKALADLNEALKLQQSSDSPEALRKHSEAVMRYHRALVHERLGDTVAADTDRRRVIELGYQPNDDLY